MDFLLKLSRLIDAMSRTVGKGIIWLVLAAVLISTINAIMRKAFNIGSNAYLEIQWYLYAAVFLLGAGQAFMQNAHVRIDVLANMLSRRTRIYVDIAGILIFLLPLCYLIVSLSWPVVYGAYESQEMSTNSGGLIRWPVYAMVPAGFTLLAIQAVSELIKRAAFLAGKCPDPLETGGHEPDAPAQPAGDDASAKNEAEK